MFFSLGNLYCLYSDEHIDPAIRLGIHASLKKRWTAADQEVFIIMAIVLNPYIHDRCFTGHHQNLTPTGLYNMVETLYECIMRKEVDNEFFSAFMDYLNEDSQFSPTWMQLDRIKSIADKARRTHLGLEKVRKAMVVCMSLKRMHIASGLGPTARKRKFGEFVNSTNTQRSERPLSTTGGGSGTAEGILEADTALEAKVSLNADLVSFKDISTELIRGVDEFDSPETDDLLDDDELPATPFGHNPTPIPSTSTSTPSIALSQSHHQAKVSIPLADLFQYPGTSSDPWDGLDYYWKGGVSHLEEEMEVHEEATRNAVNGKGEGDDGDCGEEP
ncbi:hypothetical protein DXG01_005195 [Tephrocybe rancida]|nr:hypothetical protein DXG01_005195 [Tephrocybe rancida]